MVAMAASSSLLLDAMGTLVHLRPPGPLLVAELRDRFGVSLDPADAERAFRAEMSHYRAHHLEGRDEGSLRQLRCRCAEALRAELPRGGGREIAVGELVPAMLASLRFSAYADVAPALTALRRAGSRLVVVSNWDVSLPAVLERTGLTPLLDGVVTSAACGYAKPDPRIFERARELVGPHTGTIAHVGDSPDQDVAGARAAGVEPILLWRDGTAPAAAAPVRTIASLLDLVGDRRGAAGPGALG